MLEVSSGIVIFTVAAMLVARYCVSEAVGFAGLLLGMVLALAMFFSMAEVLDRSMKTEDSKTVQKRTVISSVIRYVVLLLFWLSSGLVSDQVNAVVLVIGVLGLKAGAYLCSRLYTGSCHVGKKRSNFRVAGPV